MTPPRFVIQQIAGQHDRSAFSCGNESLDRYLKSQAGQDTRRRTSVVYVACVAGTTPVCGYYTLSASELDATALPEQVRKRLPYYPQFPAVLLGRLATDQHYRGIGLGGSLLYDAFRRCHAHDAFGVMFIVVDPFPEARAFYAHHHFQDIPDQERMYIPMTEIKKLVEGDATA
jgi:GNAT superfamily N-acetyltransferase